MKVCGGDINYIYVASCCHTSIWGDTLISGPMELFMLIGTPTPQIYLFGIAVLSYYCRNSAISCLCHGMCLVWRKLLQLDIKPTKIIFIYLYVFTKRKKICTSVVILCFCNIFIFSYYLFYKERDMYINCNIYTFLITVDTILFIIYF